MLFHKKCLGYMPNYSSQHYSSHLRNLPLATKARIVTRVQRDGGRCVCCQACLAGLFSINSWIACMAMVWEGKHRRVIKPVLCHKNICFSNSFFGLLFGVVFHSQKSQCPLRFLTAALEGCLNQEPINFWCSACQSVHFAEAG